MAIQETSVEYQSPLTVEEQLLFNQLDATNINELQTEIDGLLNTLDEQQEDFELQLDLLKGIKSKLYYINVRKERKMQMQLEIM